MEFDRGELGSKKCKGKGGLKFVKTTSVSGAELFFNNDIPEWLLTEVLIRLPAKLVFRCKLVCKLWLSVISDPSFARMYVLRASLSTRQLNWTFIYSRMYVEGKPKYELFEDIYSQDLKCPSLYSFRCPFITYPSMKRYEIVGVSNDLVLYGPCKKVEQHCIYNICNPITRQWISLPPCTHCPKFVSIGFVTHVENGVLSSHRVVRLQVPFKRRNIIRFLVFISETNEWKKFDICTEQEILGVNVRHPATLNGILHWITDRHGIMAYDPYRTPDSLQFITLPPDIRPVSHNSNRGVHSLCEAYQGRLRYFESSCNPVRGFSGIGVWIQNGYNSGWCLQHRISYVDIIYDGILPYAGVIPNLEFRLEPMFFHPFDPDVVYLGYDHLGYDHIIASYNIKTRKLESHGGVFRARGWWHYWMSTFLFVSPSWPTSIAPPSSSGVIV